ncbi:hypothetical protein [Rhodanobacter lindaniclasticus]
MALAEKGWRIPAPAGLVAPLAAVGRGLRGDGGGAAGRTLRLWPNWTHGVSVLTRLWHLAVLVLAGGASYVAALFAGGFRLRDLRAV